MRLAELSRRRVALWGFGREGRASLDALRALAAPPAEVTIVTDAPPPPGTEPPAGADWVPGTAGVARLLAAEVVIRSPGISRYREDARRVAAATVVTTGTNLWFAEHADDRMVAVTGSKGKSTTTSMVAHVARAAGQRVLAAGNLGIPLLSALHPDPAPELWAVELSSQQISDLEHSPRVGVLLNLYREHLDWHGSMEQYIADKLNLFAHRGDGVAVLNGEDALTRERAPRLRSRRVWFADPSGYHTDGEALWWSRERLLGADRLRLRGRHNRVDACAALCALDEVGVDARAHVDALAGFDPLPHRLETVGEIGGVAFVNDSISTIPESAVAALDAVRGRGTVLIAGGFDRGQDFAPLARRVAAAEDVVAVVCLPPSGERLAALLRSCDGAPQVIAAADLDEAVRRAGELACPGTTVLLSPAAPSYGAFRDFEERGDAFRALVARLISSAAKW
jgi:UDP-N-acetylmuramoylalanine--D-glutamate ligase